MPEETSNVTAPTPLTAPVNPPLNFRDIVDWNAMRAQSAQIIADFLTPITTGAASDIQYVADQIARDFQLALLLPPEQAKPLIAEMGEQLGLLAEKNRIRLVNGQWAAVSKGLALAGSIASAFAGAASAGLSQLVAVGVAVAVDKIAGVAPAANTGALQPKPVGSGEGSTVKLG